MEVIVKAAGFSMSNPTTPIQNSIRPIFCLFILTKEEKQLLIHRTSVNQIGFAALTHYVEYKCFSCRASVI